MFDNKIITLVKSAGPSCTSAN